MLDLKCPNCGVTGNYSVLGTRSVKPQQSSIRRRRVCDGCGTRFTTYEILGERLRSLEKGRMLLNKLRRQVDELYPDD